MKRDFLKLADLSVTEHEVLFARASLLKSHRRMRVQDCSLAGRTLALVMEKPSTRTRVSFEAAMMQLGGSAITLSVADSQLGRGEPLGDTARVLSGYVDGIVFRTFGDERLQVMASAASVPVINGLSEGGHPVQLLADLLTVRESFGTLKGRRVAFVGDGSGNMARSWVEAAALFQFELRLAAPEGFRPPDGELQAAADFVKVTGKPGEAVDGADVVSTDVWTSMGQEAEAARRQEAFRGFCVNDALMAAAHPEAIVLHCLPAHRGDEISEAVLEGPRSRVFEEAENRMHVQKALLEHLLLTP